MILPILLLSIDLMDLEQDLGLDGAQALSKRTWRGAKIDPMGDGVRPAEANAPPVVKSP
jgi:hypothetical protein